MLLGNSYICSNLFLNNCPCALYRNLKRKTPFIIKPDSYLSRQTQSSMISTILSYYEITKPKKKVSYRHLTTRTSMFSTSLYHVELRSSWNRATTLRWSEGNMWLGRPPIDHKTSSDKRERVPISFRPSPVKFPAAIEKKITIH